MPLEKAKERLAKFSGKAPGGLKVRAYNKERTICDLIRKRATVDSAVFRQAIRDYTLQGQGPRSPVVLRLCDEHGVPCLRGYGGGTGPGIRRQTPSLSPSVGKTHSRLFARWPTRSRTPKLPTSRFHEEMPVQSHWDNLSQLCFNCRLSLNMSTFAASNDPQNIRML